ncbi:CBL-interacting serine/threonine-protein kinase 21 [Balamuthia mandrillaris]
MAPHVQHCDTSTTSPRSERPPNMPSPAPPLAAASQERNKKEKTQSSRQRRSSPSSSSCSSAAAFRPSRSTTMEPSIAELRHELKRVTQPQTSEPCHSAHAPRKQEDREAEEAAVMSRWKEFRAKRLLGEGSGGKVFLLKNRLCNANKSNKRSIVALKTCRRVAEDEPKDGETTTTTTTTNTKRADNQKQNKSKHLEAMLRNEYAVLSSIEPHENVIQVYDFFEAEEHVCLFMQYASKGDLFDYILRKGRLSQREARPLFRQLLRAVNHLHSQGFVHRDIKPENILLSSSNNKTEKKVLLADFGVATKWSSCLPLQDCVGSLDYAAPEVLDPTRAYVGPEVDLWSCGAVLYMMLTGRTPFRATRQQEVLRNIQQGRLLHARRDGLKEESEVMDLLRRMMDPNPLKRATMFEVWRHPWWKEQKQTMTKEEKNGEETMTRMAAATIKASEQPQQIRA